MGARSHTFLELRTELKKELPHTCGWESQKPQLLTPVEPSESMALPLEERPAAWTSRPSTDVALWLALSRLFLDITSTSLLETREWRLAPLLATWCLQDSEHG